MKNNLNRRDFIRWTAAGATIPFYQRIMGSASTPKENSYEKENEIILTKEALEIHSSAIVIDGHNDLPARIRENGHFSLENFNMNQSHEEFHTDIPRLRKGGVNAQFWVSFVHPKYTEKGDTVRVSFEQIELIHRITQKHPDTFEMAYNANDIKRISGQGKIASLIGLEGGQSIENSLSLLRSYYKLGARYLTLTHNYSIDWADSGTDKPLHGGLTGFGEKVVEEMNKLGMLVDVSHTSTDTVKDVLRISLAPVIASHSSAYSLASTPRNITDENLEGIANNGGIVMVCAFPFFLTQEGATLYRQYIDYMLKLRSEGKSEEEIEHLLKLRAMQMDDNPTCSVHKMVDHIEHIISIAGIDHVGLGSDFDGFPFVARYLEDVSGFPYITQVLVDRGYNREDIHKILGGNFLRVFQAAEI